MAKRINGSTVVRTTVTYSGEFIHIDDLIAHYNTELIAALKVIADTDDSREELVMRGIAKALETMITQLQTVKR